MGPGAAGSTDVVSGTGFKAGTYALSESGPTDYTNGGYSCSKNGGAYADATSITLGLGDSAICKITNDDKPISLTLDKIVVNDNGGTRAESEWTLTANGGAAGTLRSRCCGQHGRGEWRRLQGRHLRAQRVRPDRLHQRRLQLLRRTAVPTRTPPRSRWASVTPRSARSPTTTRAEPDAEQDRRERQRWNPGESEWTLTANGARQDLSGPGAAGSTDVVSGTGFKAGTYALSESGPTDYTDGGYSCSKNGGAYADATSITLGLGDYTICKITNDDKRHQPDAGQDRRERQRWHPGESEWTLTANGRRGRHPVGSRCCGQHGRGEWHRLQGRHLRAQRSPARPTTPTAATAARRTAVPTRTPPRSRWASVTPRSARSPTTTRCRSLTLDKIVVNDNGGTAGRVRVDADGQRWRGTAPSRVPVLRAARTW